jgi:hypothetical protein
MRTVAIAQAALLVLAFGCGSERSPFEVPEPHGQAGTTGGGASLTAAGVSGQGNSAAGIGGIGAVAYPQLSVGGAGAPFEIACSFGGIDYALGDAIPSIDGCNVCTCGDRGLECSDRACRGQLSADGDPSDGDPYLACDDFDDCPIVDCECTDEDGDGECDQDCPSYFCESGICVNRGSRPCSPTDKRACLENEFCDYSLDDACGIASRGSCSLIFNELRCTADGSPACGCDGRRYRNACIARALGQSISPTDICN